MDGRNLNNFQNQMNLHMFSICLVQLMDFHNFQLFHYMFLQNKYGSIIAIEPKSGEILALVNSPGYDPNLLVGKDRSNIYKILNNDSIGKPLFERGLQGQYPPGSTFKIINALIGLQENVIEEKTLFKCNGGHFYAKNAFMKCHTNGETYSDLNKAIYTSCNTYFAKTYNEIIENKSRNENVNECIFLINKSIIFRIKIISLIRFYIVQYSSMLYRFLSQLLLEDLQQ